MRIAADTIGAAVEAAPKLAKLKQATQDFEAVLIKRMVSSMRKGIPEVKIGESLGGDMYKDMLDEVLAKTLAESEGIGLAKTLYNRMAPEVLRQFEATQPHGGTEGASLIEPGSTRMDTESVSTRDQQDK